MKVVALKPVRYSKGRYSQGDSFEAELRFAKILINAGIVREASDELSDDGKVRRRRYKRRDMVAEGSQQ